MLAGDQGGRFWVYNWNKLNKLKGRGDIVVKACGSGFPSCVIVLLVVREMWFELCEGPIFTKIVGQDLTG